MFYILIFLLFIVLLAITAMQVHALDKKCALGFMICLHITHILFQYIVTKNNGPLREPRKRVVNIELHPIKDKNKR